MIALISVVLMKHKSGPSQVSPKISVVSLSIFSKGNVQKSHFYSHAFFEYFLLLPVLPFQQKCLFGFSQGVKWQHGEENLKEQLAQVLQEASSYES